MTLTVSVKDGDTTYAVDVDIVDSRDLWAMRPDEFLSHYLAPAVQHLRVVVPLDPITDEDVAMNR